MPPSNVHQPFHVNPSHAINTAHSAQGGDAAPAADELAEFEIPASVNENEDADKAFKKQILRPTMVPLNVTRPPTAQLLYRADRLSNCAWSPVLSPQDEKPFLPDMNIQYNVQGFVFASNAYKQQQQRQQQQQQQQQVQAKRLGQHMHSHKHTPAPSPAPTPLPYDQEEVYRIRGRYPYVRYFSFTAYDSRLQSVTTLHDTQIRPSSGKNPFNDLTTTEADIGSYEIYLTKDGKRGYPNELAALPPGSTSVYALLVLRLQMLDPREGGDRSGRNREWGYVNMPVVEILNHKNGRWEVVRNCSDEFQAQEKDFIENLNVGFSRWWPSQLHLGADCNATDFSLFDPDQNPIIRRGVAVRNNNENYIFWCMPKEITQKQYVVRISGKLPQTAYGLFDQIRVADTADYDSRYVSFTTADATPLYPSYDTVSDTDIRSHYTGDPTGGNWDRQYNLVAATDVELAKKCGLYDGHNDVLIHFTRPPTLPHPPHTLAIVMRELLPQDGQERVSTEGVASVSLRNECVGPDGKLICNPIKAAKVLLKDFYPRVEVWSCNQETRTPVRLH